MFTEANTQGFSAAELETLNAALAIRLARGEDEKDASDAITNAWTPDATAEDLV